MADKTGPMKVVKKNQPATDAPTAAQPIRSPAELAAEAATQAVASAPRAPQSKLTKNSFRTAPKGADSPKGVPGLAVSRAQERAKKEGAGVYLVDTENRGHHSIVVINGADVATHGGCVQASRAMTFGRKHSQIYGVPINTSLASKEVQELAK